MPVFIALLRGINVGRAQRLPMAELRGLLSSLGHTQVATLLNSGNAVFCAASASPAAPATAADPKAMAQAISQGISQRLGLDVPVLVKTADELSAIVADNPWAPAGRPNQDGAEAPDPSRLLVVFAPDAQRLQALSAIGPLVQPGEGWLLGVRAGYLHCPQGVLASRAAAALVGRLGREVTSRNWATVCKLQALAAATAAAAAADTSARVRPKT